MDIKNLPRANEIKKELEESKVTLKHLQEVDINSDMYLDCYLNPKETNDVRTNFLLPTREKSELIKRLIQYEKDVIETLTDEIKTL